MSLRCLCESIGNQNIKSSSIEESVIIDLLWAMLEVEIDTFM